MVPIQHIRGIGAVLDGLAGALVLFGTTPAFGSVPSSLRCAWLADQSDRRRGGAARSPDRNASPRVAVYRQMGRIKSSA
jgi:hypothetical protein